MLLRFSFKMYGTKLFIYLLKSFLYLLADDIFYFNFCIIIRFLTTQSPVSCFIAAKALVTWPNGRAWSLVPIVALCSVAICEIPWIRRCAGVLLNFDPKLTAWCRSGSGIDKNRFHYLAAFSFRHCPGLGFSDFFIIWVACNGICLVLLYDIPTYGWHVLHFNQFIPYL